jgi:hypothetical protein
MASQCTHLRKTRVGSAVAVADVSTSAAEGWSAAAQWGCWQGHTQQAHGLQACGLISFREGD